MIDFVYTRLTAAYSPYGDDGWQFVGDVPDGWRDAVEHANVRRDTVEWLNITHGDERLIARSSPVGTGGNGYRAVHDSSGRGGVFILHGIVVPYCYDWRSFAARCRWISSTTEVLRRLGKEPFPAEPWMAKPRR